MTAKATRDIAMGLNGIRTSQDVPSHHAASSAALQGRAAFKVPLDGGCTEGRRPGQRQNVKIEVAGFIMAEASSVGCRNGRRQHCSHNGKTPMTSLLMTINGSGWS
jgi:hypothetical protein